MRRKICFVYKSTKTELFLISKSFAWQTQDDFLVERSLRFSLKIERNHTQQQQIQRGFSTLLHYEYLKISSVSPYATQGHINSTALHDRLLYVIVSFQLINHDVLKIFRPDFSLFFFVFTSRCAYSMVMHMKSLLFYSIQHRMKNFSLTKHLT